MKARPSIDDVARYASVSTATVSRVLNTPNSVRPVTLAKVRQAIDELGYTPNFGARALAANRTAIVGAVIPTMDNAIFAAGLQAFQETLAKSGYTMVVASSSYQRVREVEQVQQLITRGAEAMLLVGESRDPKIYDLLRHRQIPYVLTWAFQIDTPHSFVGFDNIRAARLAAEQVYAYGHRRIGIIAGQTQENDRARDRLIGFRQAYRHHGIEIALGAIREVPYDIDAAARAAMDVLAADTTITALLCGNDVLAVGANLAARQLGRKVPEDLSIIGFDDIEIARIVSPGLSTIHVPHRQMGRIAAEKLIQALAQPANKRAIASVALETRLVMRESLTRRRE